MIDGENDECHSGSDPEITGYFRQPFNRIPAEQHFLRYPGRQRDGNNNLHGKVPGELADEISELDSDSDRLTGINPNSILSHALVWIRLVGSVRATADHVELD